MHRLELQEYEKAARQWVYGAKGKPPRNGIPYELARETVELYACERHIFQGGKKEALFYASYPLPIGIDSIREYMWALNMRRDIDAADESFYPQALVHTPDAFLALVVHILPPKPRSGQAYMLGCCRINVQASTDFLVHQFIAPIVMTEYESLPDKSLSQQINRVLDWYRRVMLGTNLSVRPATYGDTAMRTTVAHYMITELGHPQRLACDFVRVSTNTYTDHRDNGKLLDAATFEQATGVTIQRAAELMLRGEAPW